MTETGGCTLGKTLNNLHPVGFWPKSLFNKMENHANIITWGGHTRCDGVNPSPPMGNGQWPGKNSASIQDIQFVDRICYGTPK